MDDPSSSKGMYQFWCEKDQIKVQVWTEDGCRGSSTTYDWNVEKNSMKVSCGADEHGAFVELDQPYKVLKGKENGKKDDVLFWECDCERKEKVFLPTACKLVRVERAQFENGIETAIALDGGDCRCRHDVEADLKEARRLLATEGQNQKFTEGISDSFKESFGTGLKTSPNDIKFGSCTASKMGEKGNKSAAKAKADILGAAFQGALEEALCKFIEVWDKVTVWTEVAVCDVLLCPWGLFCNDAPWWKKWLCCPFREALCPKQLRKAIREIPRTIKDCTGADSTEAKIKGKSEALAMKLISPAVKEISEDCNHKAKDKLQKAFNGRRNLAAKQSPESLPCTGEIYGEWTSPNTGERASSCVLNSDTRIFYWLSGKHLKMTAYRGSAYRGFRSVGKGHVAFEEDSVTCEEVLNKWKIKKGGIPADAYLVKNFEGNCALQTEYAISEGGTCKDGYKPLTLNWAACKAAAIELGFSGHSIDAVDYDHNWGTDAPRGCFQGELADGTARIHFNKGQGGKHGKIICERDDECTGEVYGKWTENNGERASSCVLDSETRIYYWLSGKHLKMTAYRGFRNVGKGYAAFEEDSATCEEVLNKWKIKKGGVPADAYLLKNIQCRSDKTQMVPMERQNECDWNGADKEGRFSLGGGGHDEQTCLNQCRNDPKCRFSAWSASGYCHNFRTCTSSNARGNWRVYEKQPESIYYFEDGNDCPEEAKVESAAECELAMKELQLTYTVTSLNGKWDWTPPGCFVHKNCDKDCKLHFGTNANSKNNGNYRAICRGTRDVAPVGKPKESGMTSVGPFGLGNGILPDNSPVGRKDCSADVMKYRGPMPTGMTVCVAAAIFLKQIQVCVGFIFTNDGFFVPHWSYGLTNVPDVIAVRAYVNLYAWASSAAGLMGNTREIGWTYSIPVYAKVIKVDLGAQMTFAVKKGDDFVDMDVLRKEMPDSIANWIPNLSSAVGFTDFGWSTRLIAFNFIVGASVSINRCEVPFVANLRDANWLAYLGIGCGMTSTTDNFWGAKLEPQFLPFKSGVKCLSEL